MDDDRLTQATDTLLIGILAGEPSGDRLGAGLMRSMRAREPKVRFVGIGGPLMLAEGLEALVPMERLAVNGFMEPVKRLPDLIRILRLLLDLRTVQPEEEPELVAALNAAYARARR